MPYEFRIVTCSTPQDPHALHGIPVQPRSGDFDVVCPVCAGHGQWNSELEEFEREHVPEFKAYLNDRPDIQEILKPYRNMGFAFIWTGYFDPTGTEVSFAIERNAAAEARLRLLVEGLPEDNRPDERQMPL